jgi:hypothetical protein
MEQGSRRRNDLLAANVSNGSPDEASRLEKDMQLQLTELVPLGF